MFQPKYEGKPNKDVGIVSGASLSATIEALLRYIEDAGIAKESSDAHQQIQASGVQFSGNTFGLGGSASGVDAAGLGTRRYEYGVSASGNKTTLSVNLTSVLSGLPDGYALVYNQIRVSGRVKLGSTLIQDTSLPVVAIPVDLDRYPIRLQVSVNMNSPNGTVLLVSDVTVEGPVVGSFTAPLTATSFEAPGAASMTQSDFNELVASNLSQIKRQLDAFQSVVKSVPELIMRVATLEHSANGSGGEVALADCRPNCNKRLDATDPATAVSQLSEVIADLSAELRDTQAKLQSHGVLPPTSTPGTGCINC